MSEKSKNEKSIMFFLFIKKWKHSQFKLLSLSFSRTSSLCASSFCAGATTIGLAASLPLRSCFTVTPPDVATAVAFDVDDVAADDVVGFVFVRSVDEACS